MIFYRLYCGGQTEVKPTPMMLEKAKAATKHPANKGRYFKHSGVNYVAVSTRNATC